jgi:4-amino-4-deoxy-L-arabinose transferase-like glycosyltransferase
VTASKSYNRFLPIAAIIIVAAFLRLTHMDLMEFKGDEAGVAMMVAEALGGGEWPMHGLMSSVGIYNPPVFIYLMMIPGLFSIDPIFLTQFVALLNVAAVFLTWWFGRRIFNERIGLIAAMFFAVSPWAVIYSRKIWAQDCIPIFSLLVIGGLHECIVKDDRRWFLPAFIAAGLLPGLHFSGLFAAFLFGVFVLAFRPKVAWWQWGIGIVVMSLAYVPYLLNHASSGGMGKSMSGAHMSADAVLYAAEIMSHFGFDYLISTKVDPPLEWGKFVAVFALSGSYLVVAFAFGFCLLTGEVFHLGKEFTREGGKSVRPKAAKLLCWGWLVLTIKGYLWLSLDKQIYPHYLVILYPIQFWLAAVAIGWVLERAEQMDLQVGKVMGVKAGQVVKVFTVLIAFAEALLFCLFLRYVYLNGELHGDYGVAYEHKKALVEKMITVAEEGEAVPLLDDGQRGDRREYQYLLLLLRPVNELNTKQMRFRVTSNPQRGGLKRKGNPLKFTIHE